MASGDVVRVLRILEYVGPLDKIQQHLAKRLLDSRSFNRGTPETTVVIREVCCGWPQPADVPYEIAGYHRHTEPRSGGAYPEDQSPPTDVLSPEAIAEAVAAHHKNKEPN